MSETVEERKRRSRTGEGKGKRKEGKRAGRGTRSRRRVLTGSAGTVSVGRVWLETLSWAGAGFGSVVRARESV
jgi:hypothetical protein